METKINIQLVILIITTLILSGCNLLVGSGTDLFIPNDPDDQDLNGVPYTDGFDFPVGDHDANGWSVAGYDFLEWSNYSGTWHPGEDWNLLGDPMADWGAPVYSVANGIVIFSGWNTAQGNIVLIEHVLPDDVKIWSQYAHLDQRNVEAGDIVERRELIGTVGRGPNNQFPPHLHFELRRKYQPQNGWPRTNGQAWEQAQVLEYYLNPSEFINQNRPSN